MAWAVMRMEAVGDIAGLRRRLAHNERTKIDNPRELPGQKSRRERPDPAKRHLNKTIYRMDKEEAIRKIEAHMRWKAVPAIEIVLSASPEFFKTADAETVEKWRVANRKWVEDTFGPENLISLEEHNDEKTMHWHAVVTPIVTKEWTHWKNKDKPDAKKTVRSFLSAEHFMGHWGEGKEKLRNLQTSYGEAMKPFGIKRGRHKSAAKHTTIDEYYAILNAIEADMEEVTRLPSPEEGRFFKESAEDWIERSDLRRKMKILVAAGKAGILDKRKYGHLAEEIELLKVEADAREEEFRQEIAGLTHENGDLRKRVDELRDEVRQFKQLANDIAQSKLTTEQIEERVKEMDMVPESSIRQIVPTGTSNSGKPSYSL